MAPRTPTALTIAGSDSGGGAGIQADLKAFASCGVHGTSAITAITAQNTLRSARGGARRAGDRARAGPRGAPTSASTPSRSGCSATLETARAVEQALAELPPGTPVVVDPVMVAESGARLIEPDAERLLAEKILPLATVVTPNLLEARVLAGRPQREQEEPGEAEQLIRAVLALGPAAVVLTGGHRAAGVDLFLARGEAEVVEIAGERHPGGRRTRLGLHPLGRARRPAGARTRAAGGGADRPRPRGRRGGARSTGSRRGRRTGRRGRSRPAARTLRRTGTRLP